MTILRLTAVGLALLISSAAGAASLFVKPTTVILARGDAAASVTLTNSGDVPVTAQVRVFGWEQSANEDRLTATSALAASPPMMTIPAGQSQTIRLVRTQQAAAVNEESYRILVDEINDRTAAAGAGVQMQLRYSVPVFVMPKPNEPAQVAFTASLVADGLVIQAANQGKSHAQISNVSLRYADGSARVVNGGLVGYVLPAKARQWRLDLPTGVSAQTKAESVRALVNGQELIVKL